MVAKKYSFSAEMNRQDSKNSNCRKGVGRKHAGQQFVSRVVQDINRAKQNHRYRDNMVELKLNNSSYSAEGRTKSGVIKNGSKQKGLIHKISSSQQAVTGMATAATNDLVYIENIAHKLSPEEVQHLLFYGEGDEDILWQFFPDSDQSQVDENEDLVHHRSLHPAPSTDLSTYCLYCRQNLIYDTTEIAKRTCGHYFHLSCYHAQPPSAKDHHIWSLECCLCGLREN